MSTAKSPESPVKVSKPVQDSHLQYRNLLHCAQVLDQINNLLTTVKASPGESENSKELFETLQLKSTGSEETARSELPRVAVLDQKVYCNGVSLDLSRRPTTLKLFKAFLDAPGYKLNRDEVLERVYGVHGTARNSIRYVEQCMLMQ